MQKNEKRFYTCGQLAIRWGCSIPEVGNFLDRVSGIEPLYLKDYPNHTGTLLAYPESEIHTFENFYFTKNDLPPVTVQDILDQSDEPLFSQEDAKEKLSRVALSNLYTMAIASQIDPRQEIPKSSGLPSLEIRRLRAQLILEEAFETVEALGFFVCTEVFNSDRLGLRTFDTRGLILVETNSTLNFEKAIDGCVDTIYVCVGTLMSMGVPDLPFSQEVCRANEAKFPNGKPVVNDAGKFQKPDGWNPPDIAGVLQENANLNLNGVAIEITRDYNKDICGEETK